MLLRELEKIDAKGHEEPEKNKKVMNIDCHICGSQQQRNKEHCPAYGQVYKLCKHVQKNHFAVKCKLNKKFSKSNGSRYSQHQTI